MNLLFKSEKVSADDVEQDLFDWARSAAGDNLLLEKNEFEKWSKKNAAKMAGWPDRAVARGKTWFHNKGYFGRDGVCTPQGAAEARHVVSSSRSCIRRSLPWWRSPPAWMFPP